jgi:tetratricopeptide (TPR) repeat protein
MSESAQKQSPTHRHALRSEAPPTPATRLFPSLWKLVNRRAQRLSAQGRLEDAIKTIARYVRLRPSNPRGWVDLGDFLLRSKNYEETARRMEQGLEQHPLEGRLVYFLALARIEQGDLDEAERILLNPRPNLAEPFFPMLAHVHLAMRRGAYAHAVALARKTAEQIPEEWSWAKYELAVKTLWCRSADDLTERLLREVIATHSTKESRYGLACIHLGVLVEKTSPAEAATLFEQARRNWNSPGTPEKLLELDRSVLHAQERQAR